MTLLSWYPLINNCNNQGLDDTNLTMTGTVFFTNGKLANAATFTGTTANRLTRPLFKETSNLTFCAWVKPSKHTSTGYFFTNSRADAASDGWGIGIMTSAKLRFCFGSYTPTIDKVISDETWHHVAMTVDSNKLAKCYIDGVQVASATVTTLPDYSEGQLFCIGAFQYSNSYIYPVTGQVQDFRYYNHCLSTKEIQEIAKGLCCHYQLKGNGVGANILVNSKEFCGNVINYNPNGCTITRTIETDETAPTNRSLKMAMVNTSTTARACTGIYFVWTSQFGTTASEHSLSDFLTLNETYTYSFYAKADSGNISTISLLSNAVCETQTLISSSGFTNLTNAWTRHTVTFKWTKNTKLTACFYVTAAASATTTFYISGLKLEKGSVATPWIPNKSDNIYSNLGYTTTIEDDDSTFGKNAIILGNPQTNTSSPRHQTSVILDGASDGYTFTDSNLYKILDETFTMSFWVKPEGENGVRSVYFGCDSTYSLNIEKTTSNLLRYYWGGNPDATIPNFTIPDSSWTHICIVRESTTSTKFYKNGVLIHTLTTTCAKRTSGSSVYYIGRDNRTGTTCFKGSMSDFRIYATSLSANDVKNLYKTPLVIDNKHNLYCAELVEV